jgi:Membrane-bound metallopeptidase
MKFGIFFFGLASMMAFGASAQAQTMQWGSGQWGGMQQCPYQTSMGQGSQSPNDGLDDIRKEIVQAQKDLKEKQNGQKKLDKEVARAEKDISDALETDHADFIIQHLSNRFSCGEYDMPQQESADEPEMMVAGDEGGKPVRAKADKKKMSTKPFAKQDWAEYCTDGGVAVSVCDNAAYRVEGGTRSAADKCKKGISAYKKSYSQSQKIATEIDRLKDKIESLKQDYADARDTSSSDRQMGIAGGGGYNSGTEAEDCEECRRMGNGGQSGSGTNWANVAANGITAAVAMGLGYSMNKQIVNANQELGFPTQNLYPSWGYGLPYAQQALYGAISGMTGQGSFGCGGGATGGMSAGGAFGYPSSMMMGMNGMGSMGSMGGGMYMSGMTPWGMNGNMGMGMGGMVSMGGLMNGMSPYGTMMGSMMGNSMMGTMMSNPYGMMMGSMTGIGGLMSIGGMTGYGSLMGGYGSLMGGTMMGGTMMSGYGSLMSGGIGTLMSGGIGTLMSGGSMMSSQYYSQMSSLQSEMNSLAMRMQMIQSGYYSGYGSTGSLTSGYSTGLGTSLYNYGSLSSTTGPIPVGISSGGTIYQER